MSETRRPDVNPVWPLASVTYNIDTHLALWCLDRGVGVSRGDGVTLGKQEEVVDESLHVLLHRRSWRGRDLVVLNSDRSSRHLVQALVDNSEGLAELLHTAKVSVVAVAVDTNRDVEVNLAICVVRRALADIPWHTRASKHDTSERKVESLGSRYNTNTLQPVDPDTIVCQHLLGLIDTITELCCPLVDVIEKAHGNILVDTTWSDVGGVETSTRYTLIEFLLRSQINIKL